MAVSELRVDEVLQQACASQGARRCDEIDHAVLGCSGRTRVVRKSG